MRGLQGPPCKKFEIVQATLRSPDYLVYWSIALSIACGACCPMPYSPVNCMRPLCDGSSCTQTFLQYYRESLGDDIASSHMDFQPFL